MNTLYERKKWLCISLGDVSHEQWYSAEITSDGHSVSFTKEKPPHLPKSTWRMT
jgi:hypothetical protein